VLKKQSTFRARRTTLGVIFLATSASFLTIAPSVAYATPSNLVQNGSFESPALASGEQVYTAASTSITGWTVATRSLLNPGSIKQVASNVWPADTGKDSVDLSGTSPGGIYQLIPTTPGTVYTLTFALGGDFNCGQSLKTLAVVWDGDIVFTPSFNDSSSSSSNMNWQQETVELEASDPTTKLEFADVTPDESACGAVIDSVVLTATPPSATPEAPSVALIAFAAVAVIGTWVVMSRRRSRRPAL
jgi:choice-of-anchor C domain-containing protein